MTYDTLDGGPPSEDRVAFSLEIFNPLEGILGDDPVFVTAAVSAYRECHRRPGPICGACDYEFSFGEVPRLIFCAQPFIPKGEEYSIMTGVICPRCAQLSPEEVLAALFRKMRELKPDMEIVGPGEA